MSGGEWVVFCPAHQHYLVFAGATGTTWADDQGQARRYPSKPGATRDAGRATWRDHNPTPWPVTW